ncbi:MAG: 16S rRNA (guanine(527)-N(7))-methyltransferase RsmG [Acinetobacter sp.]|nr:16S rRNA (guanine(527)-N(7))-methyltransferase RsmG [Acinetobacter sp.]
MAHLFFQALQQGTQQLGLNLSDDCLNLLLKYQDALILWNKAYNLTAIREPKEMLIKHLLDSLSILPHLPAGRLLDVGTGGGMPGMMIALCQPERECVLLDSNGKKIRFLKQFIADLKLSNVQAVQTRVEDAAMIQQLGQFDVITSRAFASLSDFIIAAQPYMHAHSYIAAMKGLIPHEDIQAYASQYQHQTIVLNVPHLDEQRHLIMLQQRAVATV